MKKLPKFSKNDTVCYKISKKSKTTYYGIILTLWHSQDSRSVIYEVASLNDGMCSYSIGEEYIIKKID